MPTQTNRSRRTFLGKAAAAVATPQIIARSALGDENTAAASERVTFAIIGTGSRGSRHLALGGGAGQLVGVCDTWKDRRDAVADRLKVPAYNDFREVLARDAVDAVVITVPDHWHVPVAIAAAKAGKDIFCEKALGISVAADLALRKVVKRYGTVFQYGPQRRAGGNWRHMCELVRNGRIGEVRQINVTAETYGACAPKEPKAEAPPESLDYGMWLGPAPMTPYVPGRCKARGWYCIYDYCLGWISAWGSHVLSIAQWGYDTHKAGITEYEGTGVLPDAGLNDNLISWDVKMRCANGVTMSLKTGTNAVEFVGSEGTVWVSDRGRGADPASLWEAKLGPDDIRLKSADLGRDFVECVKSRQRTVGPIDDAVYSDIISHISDIAIRLKRKVRWDPAEERIIGDDEATHMLSRPAREPWRV